MQRKGRSPVVERLALTHPISCLTRGRVRAVRALLVTVTAATLVVGVAACGDDTKSASTSVEGKPPATPSGTLRVALAGEPQTLDPTRMASNFDIPITTALYDGLLTRTPDDFERLSPALATSWKSNSDATEWTFTLRKGVRFSDGTAFDAAAAKKSLEYYQRTESIFSFAVGPISEITTPDESTVVVSYKQAFPDLARYMPLVKMISPKLLAGTSNAAERRLATNAAGTGPYVLDSFSSSRGVVAHANPSYWGDGPHIKTIELRPIVEESARNAALQAGDIDLVTGISPRTAQSFSSDPQMNVSTLPSWTAPTLSLATQKAPLNDVRVRRALAYAFDREAIAENVLLGYATVTGTPQPPGTYGFRKPATQYSYDPAKAKALLDEAGISQPVSLTMVAYSSNTLGGSIGQALAEQAKAAGFDVRFVQVPDAAGLGDLDKPQREYDIHMLVAGWVNGGPFHLAAGLITRHANYDGKKLLDLVAQMGTTPDGPEREQMIGDGLEEVAKEVPEIPLFSTKLSDASVAALQKHVPAQDGYLPNWSEQYLTVE
jgi:peptide/nickel transport system substrate-binding protein